MNESSNFQNSNISETDFHGEADNTTPSDLIRQQLIDNETLTGTASTELIILSSLLFMCIGVIGIGGNLLVICSVMCNKKMRTSMTNLLITNLAVADLLIMVFGIPEIVVVVRNSGYLYNLATCKANRYVLVTALYGSSLTLVALSVERLSENLTEDKILLYGGSNLSFDEIYAKATDEIHNPREICNQNNLFKILKTMFPGIKRSKKKIKDGKFLTSVMGLKFETDSKENISFLDLHKIIPEPWNVLKSNSETLRVGFLSPEKFNGNSVLSELTVGTDSVIEVFVAGKAVDLSNFFIRKKIKFEIKAVLGLFKSLKTISLCHGAYLVPGEPDIYSSGQRCVKEIYENSMSSSIVIRHLDCLRVVPISSLSSTCIKCAHHKKYKKANRSRKSTDKENCDPDLRQRDNLVENLRKIAPNLSQNQLILIAAQIRSSDCESSKGMRWPKEIISMSLTLFNRNPSAYRDMTKNGWLNLPSESILHLYKSAIKQRPGIIPEMMEWMRKEAERLQIPEEGLFGGIILDEMSIQEDLQIVNKRKSSSLYGLVEFEKEVMLMHNIHQGKHENKLANHVMQYLFHGLSGFRWPFANYPTSQANPSDIFVCTWKCIDALYEWGFKPIYCCMDGSSNNRTFLKMHFSENDLLSTKMVAYHYKNPKRKMIFIMDPCHLLKKLRNSVLSSGIQDNHQRLLTVNGKTIQWQMWIDAYNWDQNNHAFKLHHKLTQEHIFPNSAQKMRNKLAFETLNSDMLNLMSSYRKSLGNAGQEALAGVIEFLTHSSFFVSFFTDTRPIKDMSDTRLNCLIESYSLIYYII